MALQTFTAGQVLTAAQVNNLQANDYNQTVSTKTDSYTLVAADKGTRVVMNKATATTITVNTSLFNAGDTLWIHNIGAGVCTITAGTATVSTSGSLALAQNAGGTLYFTSAGVAIFFPTVASSAQGLTLLNTTSFSGVSSVSLPAATFNATYDNYRIIINHDSSAGAVGFNMRMRASGTDNTSANYVFANSQVTELAAFAGGASGTGALTTSWTLIAISGTYSSSTVLDVLMPFNSSYQTNYTAMCFYFDSLNNNRYGTSGGATSVTTSYDSLTFFPASGTITGSVSVYGYNK
jgi:hypothetical protein